MSDSPRTLLQKIILCVLAVMPLLFGALTAWNNGRPGVPFEEGFLYLSQEGERTVYSGRAYHTPVTIAVYPDNGGTAVEFTLNQHEPVLCRVDWLEGTVTTEFKTDIPRVQVSRDGEVLFLGGWDRQNGFLFGEDGSWDPSFDIRVHINGDGPWEGYEFSAIEILRFAGEPEPDCQGSWGMFAIGVILSVIAALATAFPRFFFYWNHAPFVKDPEPTEFYMACQMAGIVILTVVIFIIYCMGLNSLK